MNDFMTNYVVDKKKLREILLAHKTFISQRCQILSSQGIDIRKLTYGETNKFTDEFIEEIINELPIDTILDDVDRVTKATMGFSSKEILEKRTKQQ
jgi:hypothetical protein